MTPDEVIGKLHRACTQIRLAIAVYEKEVPPEEVENLKIKLAEYLQDKPSP